MQVRIISELTVTARIAAKHLPVGQMKHSYILQTKLKILNFQFEA